jgi:tRNA1Val (adenine37-N6)-methyltransferase
VTSNTFKFKQFFIKQDVSKMKVNTDSVLLGAWAEGIEASRILDVGTGTGVIALMMAQKCTHAKVIGIDIDEDSVDEAQGNVAASPFAHRVSIIQSSLQEYTKLQPELFDVIISNPPYFNSGTHSLNESKLNTRHTVKLPHIDLITCSVALLNNTGLLYVILPNTEGVKFIDLAIKNLLHLSYYTSIKHRQEKPIERILLGFSKKEVSHVIKHEILIMKDDLSDYTDEYKELTKAFYQHF